MEKSSLLVCLLFLHNVFEVVTVKDDNSNVNKVEIKSERIVGGEVISLSDAPYQVSLQYNKIHLCGGSIISPWFIITAAHCTTSLRAKYLSVRIGTVQAGVGGEVILVKSVNIHPSYDVNTFNNDFSLLLLASMIDLQPGIKEAIQLPLYNEEIFGGTKAIVSGWGDTKNAFESRDFLRGVVVQTISYNVCKKAYMSSLTSQMLCAGDMAAGGVDSCQLSFNQLYSLHPV